MNVAQKVTPQRSNSFSPEPRVLPMPSKKQTTPRATPRTTPRKQNQTPPRSSRLSEAGKLRRDLKLLEKEMSEVVKASCENSTPLKASQANDSFDVWRSQLRAAAGIGEDSLSCTGSSASSRRPPSSSSSFGRPLNDNYDQWREQLLKTL